MPPNGKLESTITMDFDALAQLSRSLQDHGYIEFIWHKFFKNPNAEFQNLQDHNSWHYPECWLARYWLYYTKHQHILQKASILDLGSNFNMHAVWAITNGAGTVHCVEPDEVRYNLGVEYIKLRNLHQSISTQKITLNQFMQSYDGKSYDIVFLLDLIYYTNNHYEILSFIKTHVKPKFLFLESTVVDDVREHGHMEIWYPSTDTKQMQSVDTENSTPLALMPSRLALRNMISSIGWKILTYYDYKDFIGHGESLPRKTGYKDFYVLTNDA